MPDALINPGLPSAVVLLSGGLDSAVCLAVARRDGFAPHALCVDYGQRHAEELAAARDVAAHGGAASFITVRLDLRAVGGSALTADIAVPRAGESVGVPVTYVPARNLAFLAIAAGYAETLNATAIYIGVNAVDYSGYPDCRPEFIAAFERAVALGTRAGDAGRGVRVRTPLMELSKGEIIRLGATLGVDFSRTHSCYSPVRGLACGTCDSCDLRRKGFRAAGVPDATRYAPAS